MNVVWALVSVLPFCRVVGAALPHSAEWGEFKGKFGKTYNGMEEEARRFEIFGKNMDFIQTVNAKGLSYKLGWNQFTDLTGDEFAAQFMGYRMPKDLYFDAPFLGNHTWNEEELPSSVDWTAKGAVTPVKDQGQCGSCWHFLRRERLRARTRSRTVT